MENILMNWDLICYLLENYAIVKSRNQSFTTADYILLLDENAQDRENTIYISDGSRSSDAFREALVIQVGRSSVKSRNYITLSRGTVAQVLNTLLQARARLDLLSARLSAATQNQEAIDIASDCLHTILFYFDASYRILAITGNVDLADDPEWKHMTEKRFLSPASIRLMQESGDLDMLAAQTEPTPYDASYYPFSSIVCNIRNHDMFLSRLNMLCIDSPPDELKKQECRVICSHLLRIARSSDRNLPYIGPLDSMVMDLLRGVQLSEELIYDRLKNMPQLLSSLVQVCCIEPDVRNDPQVLRYYSALIDRMFEQDNVLTLEYDGKIVLILHAPDEEAFGRLHERLSGLLDAQKLKCGAGNLFRRFSALREHYLQALATLSLGRKEQGINHFREVYFDYVLSFIPQDRAMAMISYGIVKLMQVQKEYQFPLAHTLQTYLECSCNLQLTADRLFLHKNTALYRLNHIRDIINMDLEDADLRMQLLLSFKIIEKYGLYR